MGEPKANSPAPERSRLDCSHCLGRKVRHVCRCFMFGCDETGGRSDWWNRCPTVEFVPCWECRGTGRQEVRG